MKQARLILILGVVVVLGAAVAEAAKPNFSGDWKMNVAKSDFGAMPTPTSFVQKITHSDPELSVTETWVSDMGEMNIDLKYTTDGKECVNSTPMGEIKSAVKWDGEVLLVDSAMDFQGNSVTVSDKWAMSEDGKTITLDRRFTSPQGEGTIKVIMEKQ